MLRRPPTNLNRQSEEATILLIREVLDKGISLSEVYVDALGTTTTYQAYLSKTFPGIEFTVTPKADSKFKIVGAASVAAKVTRDACVEDWLFEEDTQEGEGVDASDANDDEEATKPQSKWLGERGSGYPGGTFTT
jgi:ribonuclease H2 subunit A